VQIADCATRAARDQLPPVSPPDVVDDTPRQQEARWLRLFDLYVHGIVLTAWYALILAQTSLVAAHRIDLHRRLGVLAVGVAMAVVPLSTFVVVRAVPRMQGRDPATLRILVVGDLLMLVFFTGFVAAGV